MGESLCTMSTSLPSTNQHRIAHRDELCQQAVEAIHGKSNLQPVLAIILGSGLGGLATKINNSVEIDYEQIPGFARSTAGGHRGRLIIGTLEDRPVVAMAGRFHRYEGWTSDQTAFPVFVMNRLGADALVVSNAAGGVNPKLSVGDLVIIRDHINMMSGLSIPITQPWDLSPLRTERTGGVYDAKLAAFAKQVAIKNQFTATAGTYLATFGPTYETRAEYRMMRKIGADVAGMSTVPEVLAASAIGMKVLGLSMVTNVANPDRPIEANHDEVLEAGRAAAVKMETIVRAVLSGYL